jgi:hypothetical protein
MAHNIGRRAGYQFEKRKMSVKLRLMDFCWSMLGSFPISSLQPCPYYTLSVPDILLEYARLSLGMT